RASNGGQGAPQEGPRPVPAGGRRGRGPHARAGAAVARRAARSRALHRPAARRRPRLSGWRGCRTGARGAAGARPTAAATHANRSGHAVGNRTTERSRVKVALLMGGRSAEREISLRTGRGIAQALRNLGHDVTALDAANGRLLPAGEEERAALPAAAVEK